MGPESMNTAPEVRMHERLSPLGLCELCDWGQVALGSPLPTLCRETGQGWGWTQTGFKEGS